MLLKKTAFSPSALVLAAALAVSACSQDQDSADRPTPAPTPTAKPSAVDPKLAPGVIIRVAVDASGKDVNGSAAMRTTDADLSVIAPSARAQLGAEVEAAFAVGKDAPVAKANALTSELDRDSSTQSWADYTQASSYDNYQPVAYAQGSPNQGAQYSYQTAQSFLRGLFRYYFYTSPTCGQCSPNQSPIPQPLPVPTPKPYPTPGPTPGQGPLPLPGGTDYDAQLRSYLQLQNVRPAQDSEYLQGTPAQIKLGEKLFYDRILSGNGDTSCSTCHVADLGTSNRVSLGPTLKALKKTGNYTAQDVLPRNSPSLYNRGHNSYTQMFWDSRVGFDAALNGYRTPAGAATPNNLSSALAAQSLFPITSRDEMLGCLGQYGSSASPDFAAIWGDTVRRVLKAPSYRNMLAAAYPGVGPDQIGIEHLGNAIAAYESWAWRADKSPFDRYLKGDSAALSDIQKRGATYFYGKANCSSCHAGVFQTDQQHHAIGIPQFGPGLSDGPSGKEDFGWERVTKNQADRYKFRTPSLRNVTLTGPWGHDGAYSSLKSFVNHYVNPAASLNGWNYADAIMPWPIRDQTLFAAWDDQQARQNLLLASELQPVGLNPDEVNAILAFLHALTDTGVLANAQGGAHP